MFLYSILALYWDNGKENGHVLDEILRRTTPASSGLSNCASNVKTSFVATSTLHSKSCLSRFVFFCDLASKTPRGI